MNIGQETEQVEFKKSTGELKEGLISLSSMLNKHGSGILWFGIKNNGDVIGQAIGDGTLRDISQAVAVNIKPVVIPTISLVLMDDRNVIKVEVAGEDKPYSAYGKYYMRSADEDREITPMQLRELMLSGKAQSISTMDAENQDLSFTQLKSLYISRDLTISPDTFLKNTGLKTGKGTFNLMAELLADNNPYSIKVARFEGKDKTKLIMRNEYGYKCLILAMQQAMDYVEAIDETRVVVGGSMERQEQRLFDFDCFREAWVNACLHNKWTSQVPPAVYIFEDRIEIVSTGGLPADYTLEEFFAGISRPINIGLQKIMGQLDIVEQTGHGVPLIVKKYGREAFRVTEHFVTVVLPFAYDRSEVQSAPSLMKNQAAVLKVIRESPQATIADISSVTGLSSSSINTNLRKLKGMGLIVRQGGNRYGQWIVK